jgi:predicted phage terminase large subunit-like protein
VKADTELRPQPGPQEEFLRTAADIAIFGGSAGGGKTFGLLLEPLYHVGNPRFGGVIFRRTVPQIRVEGGLWQTSQEVYPLVGATGLSQSLEWRFPSGAQIKLAHMEHEKNRFDWQGAQIAFIAFDEICQFTANQFWYLVGRNRSMSGIRGYIRGTCNPDPDSWVRHFIGWWINPDTGFAIPERSGILRWFVRNGDELIWADSKPELVKKFGPGTEPKSVTFIPSTVFDNKLLLERDPAYLSNLKALPALERAQLLEGNWNVRASAGSYFKREYFGTVNAPPQNVVGRVRFWDRAATEKRTDNDPDATVGLLLSRDQAGIYYVEDVRKLHASPYAVERAMRNCAEQDGENTIVAYMQDPGSAGVAEAQATARALDGFNVRFSTASGDKETRAKPISAQAEAGNVKLVRGLWNDEFLRVLENFPVATHDDEVDGLSGAHETLRNTFGTHAKVIERHRASERDDDLERDQFSQQRRERRWKNFSWRCRGL